MRAPVAPRLPLVGNGLAFLREPLGFLREMRDRHGDVVRVALGPMEATLVSHPDLVEDVLVARNRLWRKDAYLRTSLRPVLGQGLLSSEGDFWRRQRRLAQPAFHRERVAAYGAIMVEHAERLARRWRDGEVRDLHEDMMRLTLEIVAQALFGANVGDRAKDVGDAVAAILAYVSDPVELFVPFVKRLPTRRSRHYARAVRELDAIVYGVIERRRRSEEAPNDLLSMLLHARDEDGSRMSDEQLRDECMTLFLAGHETTAIALSWTWLLLSEHPRVREALEAELDALGDRPATVEDLPRLRYTGQVVAESMRLYPPAWAVGRRAINDFDAAGYHIPARSMVLMSQYITHRDARFYPDPERFDPDRWLPEIASKRPKFSYFPFGGGTRICIGEQFAWMEGVLILATIGQRWKLRYDGNGDPEIEPQITLRPRGGLQMRLVRRQNAAAGLRSR